MRLLWLILKDFKTTISDTKTVALMFAAPVIILLLVGFTFVSEAGGQPATLKQVPVGVCNLDFTDLSSGSYALGQHSITLVDEISKHFKVTEGELGDDCPVTMQTQLSRGNIRAYLVIPKNFSGSINAGQQARIQFYADNAKPDTYSLISGVSQGIVFSASQEMGNEFVKAAWGQLSEMSGNLDSLTGSLDSAGTDIDSINNKTAITLAKIKSFDVSGLRTRITAAKSSIDNLSSGALALRDSVRASSAQADNLSDSMAEIEVAVVQMDSGITTLRADISGIKTDLNNAYSDAFCAEADAFSGVDQLFLNRWRSICLDMRALNTSLGTLYTDLEAQRANLLALGNAANNTRQRIIDVKAEITVLDSQLSALDQLQELSNSLDYMDTTLVEFQSVQDSAATNLEETTDILVSVQDKIATLRSGAVAAGDKLDLLVSRDPQSVITPLAIDSFTLFQDIRYIDSLFPSIVAVILMFVTVLFSAMTIIKEKAAGTLKRVLLSPVRSMEFVLSKVALIVGIALVQAVVLFLIGFAVFAVKINWLFVPFSLGAIALSAITFSSIGMIIASLSDSENTALLASLVLCLPLLFLSGIFFPIELMMEPVQWISFLSPLTHSVVLLEQFLTYNIDPLAAGAYLTGLLIWTGIALAISTRQISKLRG